MSQDQNSLLTDKQREFLETPADERGEEYSKQMASYHWRNIRARLWSGFDDFKLLSEALDEDDRRRMLESVGEDQSLDRAGELEHPTKSIDSRLPDVIAFIYQQADNSAEFEEIVHEGVTRGVERDGWFADVDVNVSVDRTHRVDAPELLDQGHALLDEGIPETMTREEYEKLTSALRKAGIVSSIKAMRLQAAADKHEFADDE